MKTLYDLLGVSPRASLTELEAAYRRQLDAHLRVAPPFRRRMGQRRMRALREAFLLLATPAQRAEYDRLLARRAQARQRRMRHARAALSACSLILGCALIGSAWYR